MRLASLALLGLALPLAAQDARTYTLAGESVAIYNIAGQVTVTGGGRGGAVTVAVARAGDDAGKLTVETGEIRGRATLRVLYPEDRIIYSALGRGSNSTFHIREDGTWGYSDDGRGRSREGRRVTVRGDGDGLEASADLQITIPEGKRAAVYLAVGRIVATNLNGEIRLDAMSGDISARGTRGRLDIDTGSGNIELTDAAGIISLDTGSGDVTVTSVREGNLTIDTGSGSVVATGIVAGRLEVETGSGDVRVDGARAPVTSLETGSGSVRLTLEGGVDQLTVETGSGDVYVRLPEAVSAMVDLETGSGDFDLAIPLTLVRKSEDQLQGRLGEGRGRIQIETGSGDITLAR